MTSLLWFRRDLRLGDHPALLAAAERGPVLGLFVLDPVLMEHGGARAAYLLATLEALGNELRRRGGQLVLRTGRAHAVVPAVAAEIEADEVHISADHAPYGVARDRRVEEALDLPLVRTGSPYAVSPGRLSKGDGEPYKVFTPFHRAWQEHGWRVPAESAEAGVDWLTAESEDLPDPPAHEASLPEAGEAAALARWQEFCDDGLERYPQERDRPDLDSTSRMSAHLKLGTIHPRTMLADLAGIGTQAAEAYRRQLCWRDFYGAVLAHWPRTTWEAFQPRMRGIRYDEGAAADEAFEAWASGTTGYPIVDAGMRQLRAEGWMHNRVRMLVASFLTKDLHVDWRRGAAHFMAHLIDGDVANNQHGWQWTAGTGTDASPYFRVFNPVRQGERFDPDGEYVRRWIPELADVPTAVVHRPWDADDPPPDYPPPILDHAQAREEALARYGEVSS